MTSSEGSGYGAVCPNCGYTTLVFVKEPHNLPGCPECSEWVEKETLGDLFGGDGPSSESTLELEGPTLVFCSPRGGDSR